MLSEYQFVENNLTKEERKETLKNLTLRLSNQQMAIRDAKLPVVVIVDGWDAAGKGGLINQLISELDPRFTSVFSADSMLQDANRYPFLYPYVKALPETGKLLFMDSGWMENVVRARIHRDIDENEYSNRLTAVNDLERTLRDNGYIVVKLFVHIPEKTQKKRLSALQEDKNTAWRVTDSDMWQNRKYDSFLAAYDSFIEANQAVFPWHILDGKQSKKDLYLSAYQIVTDTIDAAIRSGRVDGAAIEKNFPMTETPKLADSDLTATLTEEEYKQQLKFYQKKLNQLHYAIYRKKIPVVVCFEGWDAAGKGGAIRRLAYPLDPRGFDVFPIASPEPHEKARHYLWRFWTRLPKSGHVAIFDRTWYGRVMVERLEGYCSENSWRRAYTEINEFEKMLTDAGTVVLKFWIQIDPDTQLERFTLRQNTPEKQWKITEEDWRNREKWADYEKAISEMLEKTSTVYAPWHIVESVDKHYARVKVLRIVTEALEKALAEVDDKKN